MSLFSKLKFLIIAILILVLGYFFGIIILGIIAGIIILILILFILAWLFNKSAGILNSKLIKLFFKMLFSSAIVYGIISLIYNILLTKIIKSNILRIIIIWTISSLIFGILWNSLQIKLRNYLYVKNNIIDYKIKQGINIKDIIFILIISSIITYILNLVYVIV